MMTWISWAALYFIVWWLCLFAVLPFGVTNQSDTGEITHGSEPGAPVAFRLWKKLALTTLVAAIVVMLAMWVLSSPLLQQYWR